MAAKEGHQHKSLHLSNLNELAHEFVNKTF